MKKFLFKLFLFCLPLAAVYALPVIFFALSREFLPVHDAVLRQQRQPQSLAATQPILYDPDIDVYRQYKIESTRQRNPEIIVLGTSRTLTLQSGFFKDPAAFYNAGFTAGQTFKTADLVSFINAVPQDSKLKVILLDASSLLTESAVGQAQDITPREFYETLFTAVWRNLYFDYFQKKFSLLNVIKTEKTNQSIGINARLLHNGLRSDGSLDRNTQQSPEQLQAQVQSDLASELAFIVPGQGGFSDYSATIPQQDVEELNKFLAICKARNIYVVGYLSPFATELAAKMQSLGDSYTNSYNQTPVTLNNSFSRYSFPFYDIRNLSLIHSSDQELYDSHHPTEKGTIKMLMYLNSQVPQLNAYLDNKALANELQKQKY